MKSLMHSSCFAESDDRSSHGQILLRACAKQDLTMDGTKAQSFVYNGAWMVKKDFKKKDKYVFEGYN